jgi:dihydrofolate reductase
MKDDQGFADRMNSLPKYVVSRTLGKPTWNNTSSVRVNAREEVLKLKAQGGRDLLVFGSARLVQGLGRAGLIDEYRFLVYPVVLGKGKRVFEGERYAKLSLLEARQLGQVTLLRFEPDKNDPIGLGEMA